MTHEVATRITSFRGQYRFLSNFYPSLISYRGLAYPTVEHALQAAKALSAVDAESIRSASTPGDAKMLGRTVRKRKDWDEVRVSVMYTLLLLKFAADPLRGELLSTGDAELVEGNYWHDNFWGHCFCDRPFDCARGAGENWLGKLLMDVRDEMRRRVGG